MPASAHTLGQLLLSQSVLCALPEGADVVSFACRCLAELPGVREVRHLPDAAGAPGEDPGELCLALSAGRSRHGELRVVISNRELFEPYEAHAKNYSLVLAVLLDQLRDRELLREAAAELERRVTERARELSLFRALVDAASDTFEVLDASTGRILDVNEHGCRQHGYTREEYLRLTVFDLDPVVDRESMHQTVERLRRGEQIIWEGLHRRKDGTTFPVEVNLRMLQLDREYIVAAVRDVTERQRTEAEHRKFWLGVARSSDAIFLTDPEGAITYVNPAFEQLYGFAAHEALGRTPRILKSGQQDPSFYVRMWERLRDRKLVHGELVNRAKDGRLVHVDASANPIVDDAGNLLGFLAIQRDITEQKQAAAERERLEEQLRASQKMESIGSLAGGIAHDFNNLLSVINGFTGAALEELREGDPLRDDLTEVMAAGQRAAALTRQLLAFSRKQRLELVPVDLNRLCEDLEKMLRRIIGEDVVLVHAPAPELGFTLADPGQLEQVIMNLAVNARDAMPRGGTLTLETANVELDPDSAQRLLAPRPGPYVLLAVSDTGVGMDEATRKQIFEPFFTTKPAGQGTGLGLATVHGIVSQTGGVISVESSPGAGTRFSIYLPRVSVAQPGASARPPALAATGTETILVVDDEAALRKLAQRILRSAGYRVLSAGSAGEALLMLESHDGEIDLLLTDVVMPLMGGAALAERVAQTRPKTRVLFMSGHSEDAVTHHGAADPSAPFLTKPFGPSELLASVRAALDRPPD